MTRMIVIAFALVLSAHPAFSMTLSEAVETALKNNPDIQSISVGGGGSHRQARSGRCSAEKQSRYRRQSVPEGHIA